MRLAYVLHLDPDELVAGRLIGYVEEVATGLRAPMSGYDDLRAFCVHTAGAASHSPTSAPPAETV